MSCEKNSKKVGRAGAVTAGLTANSSRLSNVTGVMLKTVSQAAAGVDRTIDRVGRTGSRTAGAMLEMQLSGRLTNPQTKKAIGAALGLAGGAYIRNPQVRQAANSLIVGGAKGGVKLAGVGGKAAVMLIPQARSAYKIVKGIEAASSVAGRVAGGLSKTADAGEVMLEKRSLFFSNSKTPVKLWKSDLTGLINRADAPGLSRFSGQRIIASNGVMFETGRKTWHRGTSVVDMPEGKRALTHLQSLSLPSPHYYFNRKLSNEQAVGVASGTIKPESIPGFVGQVSKTEALAPTWAQAKSGLIKMRLYWPAQKSKRGKSKRGSR